MIKKIICLVILAACFAYAYAGARIAEKKAAAAALEAELTT